MRIGICRGRTWLICSKWQIVRGASGLTHGLPLQTLDDGGDPEVVLRDCADDHVRMRRVLCELREAVLEQVGKDQTDRLRDALSDAAKALSA